MPDYDPKSIPILDDIIDEDSDEFELNAEYEPEPSELIDIENQVDDEVVDDEALSDLSLFTSDAIEIDEAAPAPELGIIDRQLDATEDDLNKIKIPAEEAALIGHHVEQNEADIDVHQVAVSVSETTYAGDTFKEMTVEEPAVEQNPQTALSSIVDDVVKQLMPDLEQQLRHLVQQALEEKLPEEISERFSDKKPD